MSLQVRPETEARINALATASGVSVDEYLSALVNRTPLGEEPAASAGEAPVIRTQPRIWEVIAENMKDVPPEAFAKLPKDGASEIDHYLYGLPKRNA